MKLPDNLYYHMIVDIQKPHKSFLKVPNNTRLVMYRLVLKNKDTHNTVVSYSSSYLTIDENGKIFQYFVWLLDSSHKEERRQLAKHGITFHKCQLPFYRKVLKASNSMRRIMNLKMREI